LSSKAFVEGLLTFFFRIYLIMSLVSLENYGVSLDGISSLKYEAYEMKILG